MLTSSPPSVAVIGAGAAGLAALKFLRLAGLRAMALEKNGDVGGVWCYRGDGPMYRSLVTNIPKETMGFLDHPFPADVNSFVTHGQVQDYLRSYADTNDLWPLIKFKSSVLSVRLAMKRPKGVAGAAAVITDIEGERDRWEVTYRVESAEDGKGGEVTEVFDAVAVCNGHYDKPTLPDVEGLAGFKGRVMHSRDYDEPSPFRGESVLCVGSRASGTDVAREISSTARVVHVCDRAAKETLGAGGEHGNVWLRPALKRFEGRNGVCFVDGSCVEVDTVVWCTGYDYDFPFLEGAGLLADSAAVRVGPLYKQVFHVAHPSLAFIGLPQRLV
ncbi:unnamed protein product, partial [Discosporangium mesarthrocarpum]